MHNKENNCDKKFERLIKDTVELCQNHLKEIIETQPVVYWAEHLGVSKSLISARWKKDHFPNIPNIIKLLLMSGYSANWLLLGIGPKYMNHVHDPEQSAEDELRRRQMTVDFFELENQLSESQKKLKELERYIQNHQNAEWIRAFIEKGMISKSAEEIRTSSGESLFRHFILPVMTLIQSIGHIGFKLFEAVAESEGGGEKMEYIIKYIESNFEKNQFGLQSSLADLDSIIKDSGIIKLLLSLPAK